MRRFFLFCAGANKNILNDMDANLKESENVVRCKKVNILNFKKSVTIEADSEDISSKYQDMLLLLLENSY